MRLLRLLRDDQAGNQPYRRIKISRPTEIPADEWHSFTCMFPSYYQPAYAPHRSSIAAEAACSLHQNQLNSPTSIWLMVSRKSLPLSWGLHQKHDTGHCFRTIVRKPVTCHGIFRWPHVSSLTYSGKQDDSRHHRRHIQMAASCHHRPILKVT